MKNIYIYIYTLLITKFNHILVSQRFTRLISEFFFEFLEGEKPRKMPNPFFHFPERSLKNPPLVRQEVRLRAAAAAFRRQNGNRT